LLVMDKGWFVLIRTQ